jgi:hypothetical protein
VDSRSGIRERTGWSKMLSKKKPIIGVGETNTEPNIGVVFFGTLFGAKGLQDPLVPFRSVGSTQAWCCFARSNGNQIFLLLDLCHIACAPCGFLFHLDPPLFEVHMWPRLSFHRTSKHIKSAVEHKTLSRGPIRGRMVL